MTGGFKFQTLFSRRKKNGVKKDEKKCGIINVHRLALRLIFEMLWNFCFNDEVQTQEFHSMQFCVSFGPQEDRISQPIHQHKEIYYQY